MQRFFWGALIATLLLLVTGCGALHVVPEDNYTERNDEQTIRIAFDQDGTLYPDSPPNEMPKLVNWNLDGYYRYKLDRKGYDDADMVNVTVSRLTERLDNAGDNARVVVLIHGYNNGWRRANETFTKMKETIADGTSNYDDLVFLEVSWDGLYKGPITFIFPLAYWFDSMTYSNIAGQVGLRRIINRLPAGTDVTFITHSRGAGVAFSVFSDPVYDKPDPDKCPPDEKPKDNCISVPPFEPARMQLGRVELVSLAPAIGAGHIDGETASRFPKGTRIYLGFNPHDDALTKEFIGPSRFGDTRLGADEGYFVLAQALLKHGNIPVQREIYSQDDHGVENYLHARQFDCLLWAVDLHDRHPDDCKVTK